MRIRSLNYRTKFSLLYGLVLVVIVGISAALIHDRGISQLRAELKAQTAVLAEAAIATIAAGSANGQRPQAAQQALCESLARLEGVSWVEVFDGQGSVVAHSDSARIGQPPLPIHATYVARIIGGESGIEEWDAAAEHFNLFRPITWPAGSGLSTRGVLEVVRDTSSIQVQVWADLRRFLALALAIGFAAFIMLFVGMRRIVAGETARRRAVDSADHLGRIIESSLNEVYVFDADTLRFLFVNQRALDNLGYTLEEALARTPLDIKPAFTRASFQAHIAPLRDGSEDRVKLETVHRRSDGSEYDVEVFIGRDSRDGEAVLVAIIRDTTERNKVQQALQEHQKLRAIGQLAAGIAHDFNNILAPIMGYASIVRERLPKGSENAEHLTGVIRASRRARGLVNQILAFSRQSESAPGAANLVSVLTEITEFLRQSAPALVTVHVSVEPDQCVVNLSEAKIHQVITNLCMNGIQAVGDEVGTLHVELSEKRIEATLRGRVGGELKSGTYACLVISDTGCGMDTETLKRATEPFFTTKGVGDGTGLGLAVALGVVESAGGDMSLTSKPGHGTSVEVLLPVGSGVSTKPKSRDDDRPGGSEHVLLVDDDELVADSSSQALRHFGYEVSTYTDSLAALDAFRSRPDDYDIIVTDETMPGMRGTQLAKEVLASHPKMLVVLMTGYSGDVTPESCAESGILAFVRKPVVAEDLARTVRRVLDTP